MHYPVGYNRSLMVIMLMVYIIRVGRCSPDDSLSSTSDANNTDTDPTTTGTTNQSSPEQDSKPSMFSKCASEAFKSVSTLSDGLSLVLKATGQAALTVIGALFGTYNSLISVTSKTGETVAAGLGLVDNVASRVVLVNSMTGGVSKLATGFSTMFSENSKITSANREKLFDQMDKELEGYHPESKPLPTVPSTDEGDKSPDTTVTEA